MSWPSKLVETYDNCIGYIDYEHDSHGKGLLPIDHLYLNAQIEVVLDDQGNFLRATRIDKENQVTMMPVTEDSASRSSGIAPLPLDDKLVYLDGSFDQEVHPKKSKAEYHIKYMDQLKEWIDDSAPQAVCSIYQYLSKNHLIQDLKSCDAYENEDDMVRFVVVHSNDDIVKGVWQDQEIVESFIRHQNHINEHYDIDYVTGEAAPITTKAPAKIRNAGDKAKIISSNDTSGYTYRGRFKNSEQAVELGYESTQKIHNALRWLIANQGYRNDSESIVCWSTGGEEVPDIMKNDTFDFFAEDDQDELPDTASEYAMRINKALAGYQTNIDRHSSINLIGVDSADGSLQGRLAITMYYEMQPNEFFNNIRHWYETCQWKLTWFVNKQRHVSIRTPSIKEIILCAYGTQKGEFLDLDAKAMKKLVDRLIPCIVQRKKLPKDIMRAAVLNISQPLKFNKTNRLKLQEQCCAIIHKYQCDYLNREEVYEMALNETTTDRSYLFGRLLAVSERIEEYVMYKRNITGRETNTMKYWNTFTRRPAKTWAVLDNRLRPYIRDLKSISGYLDNEYSQTIEQIVDLLEQGNGFTNEPLNENYLLGYYSQKAAFRKDMEDDKDE